MDAFNLTNVNPGSLGSDRDIHANNQLVSSDGLTELMECDGWIRHDENDVDPKRYHMVWIFGYRPLGSDFNDCHFLTVDKNGELIEKGGIGARAQKPRISFWNKQGIPASEVQDYFNRSKGRVSVMPVYGGCWRMPDEGLKVHPRHTGDKILRIA